MTTLLLSLLAFLLAVLSPPWAVVAAEAEAAATTTENNGNNTTASCSFALVIPFSENDRKRGGEETTGPDFASLGSSYTIAAQLAINHLNGGIGSGSDDDEISESNIDVDSVNSIIPDLSDRLRGCRDRGLVFDKAPVVRDSENEDTVGFPALVRTVMDLPNLCGLIGPNDGKGIERTIGYTEVMNLTQILVTGGDADDYAGKNGRTTIGNFLTYNDYVENFVTYIGKELKLEYLAFLSSKSKSSRLLHDLLPDSLDRHNIRYQLLYFDDEKQEDYDKTKKDIEQLKFTGIRNILLQPDEREPEALQRVAEVLLEMDMLNGEYQYFLMEGAIRPDDVLVQYSKFLNTTNTPLAKLLHGAGWFAEIDPFTVNRNNDPFLQSWQAFDGVASLADTLPINVQDHFSLPDVPYRHSSFVYDSIIAMGLAKCAELLLDESATTATTADQDDPNGDIQSRYLQKDSSSNSGGGGDGQKDGDVGGSDGKRNKPPKKSKPTATEHVKALLSLKPFQGASGLVNFIATKNDERIRDVDGILQAMHNFRVSENSGATAGAKIHVDAPAVAVWKEGSWEEIDGEEFIFASSANMPPDPQFVVYDENFLSDWVFRLGISLFVIGLVLAVGCFAAVTWMRTDKQIQLGQPLFLQFICIGSLTENFAILTLSFDESRGGGDDGNINLDATCAATPWLFFVGHALIYAATFCKLWRVDQVMSTRRRKVTYLQVLWPIAVILFAIILILSLWTAIDPWQWHRDVVTELPPVTLGQCQSDNFRPYFWSLTCILMLCTFLTVVIVWKTKDLSDELSDTGTVFYLVVTQMQAWFIGLPILVVIGDDSINTVYLGRILLISLFAMAPLLIVLAPRIFKAVQQHLYPETRTDHRGTIRISGLSNPKTSSVAATITSRYSHADKLPPQSSTPKNREELCTHDGSAAAPSLLSSQEQSQTREDSSQGGVISEKADV